MMALPVTSWIQIGNSLFDKSGAEKVAEIVEKAKKNNVKMVFPVDYVVGDKFDAGANVRPVPRYEKSISHVLII